MGNFLQNNAGTIGSTVGGVAGSFVPIPGATMVGSSLGGMAGNAIGGSMQPDAQQAIEQQGAHRQAQMQLLQAMIMAMQQSQGQQMPVPSQIGAPPNAR